MDILKELDELINGYKDTGFKLFEFEDDMKKCYEESLKETLVDLAIRNNNINKKLTNGDIDEYNAYSERYKIRVEHELINACLAIIDGDIKSANVYVQVLYDIYGSKDENRLLYDLAKLKR